jgi:hypothetical protein
VEGNQKVVHETNKTSMDVHLIVPFAYTLKTTKFAPVSVAQHKYQAGTQRMFKRAHQNEETMKRLLPRWIKTRTHMKDVEWTVNNIIDTGILESRKSKHITGSPDGIGRLFANGNLGRECAATTTKGVRCGLAMKTMSTIHTAEEQNMLLGTGLEAVKCIDVMKDGVDNDPNKEFYDYVRCVEHRDQCFYHCVCLNCPYTLYVVGKPGDIIRVVILYFGEIILKWYTDLIIYQHCTF